MTSEQIVQIEEKLCYSFSKKHLLITAFTHSSYGRQTNLPDNERLEFLGDAILDFIVSEYLGEKFKNCEVGVLSAMRANVVSSSALRPVVDSLDVIGFLQVADGSRNIKSVSKKIKANLYEAIVAAIYLDGGFEAVKAFVLRTLSDSLQAIDESEQKDAKTLLQEYCQSLRPKKVVSYVLSERSGTDNDPTYKYDLCVDGVYMCSGVGSSRKAAEQSAAKKLVTKWRID